VAGGGLYNPLRRQPEDAANLIGDVTPGSVYAHIDQSLGPWAQRPVFKTNVKTFVSLRKAAPPIALADLQALATHFPEPDFKFQLGPEYEPERSDEQRRTRPFTPQRLRKQRFLLSFSDM
jgi:hypothetical protein